MHQPVLSLLLFSLTLTANADVQYQKAELYTLSKLFAPLCEYCDNHIVASEHKYTLSYNAWRKMNAQNISEGRAVAHQLIEQIGDKPEPFYQKQVIEMLKDMAIQSPEQLQLSCDLLRAKLQRFTESPLIIAPPSPPSIDGSN